MRSISYLLPVAALLTAVSCAPSPSPGLALLRRVIKEARAPLPQSGDNVPFKPDQEWCVWSPNGGCWLNEAATKAWDYMKVDPPKYKWDDYADTEGVYASGEDAYDAYEDVLYDLYDLINEHSPYDDYDYDYEQYIEDYEDQYCVWKWEGECWFNDFYNYVDDQWKDPYRVKKARGAARRRQTDKEDWSVYATSKGVQADYALWAWDLFSGVNEHGPLDLTKEDISDGKD